MEIWKDVPGWEGEYEVSSLGRVRRNGVLKIITKPAKKGYYYASLEAKPKKRRYIQVHALVAAAFIGPRPKGYVCDHKDRNPLNNYLSNLRYISNSANIRNSTRSDNASGVGTFTAYPRKKPFFVRLSINGKRKFFGYFSTSEEAARVAATKKVLVT